MLISEISFIGIAVVGAVGGNLPIVSNIPVELLHIANG